LLKERLPDVGDGHLTFNSDFHKNNLIYISEIVIILIVYNL
jgi:hypothetical protein